MPNTTRKCANYEYELELRPEQLDALIDIAWRKDASIESLIWQALDEYIGREDQAWPK